MSIDIVNLYLHGKVTPVLRLKDGHEVRLFTLIEIDERGLTVALRSVLSIGEALDPR